MPIIQSPKEASQSTVGSVINHFPLGGVPQPPGHSVPLQRRFRRPRPPHPDGTLYPPPTRHPISPPPGCPPPQTHHLLAPNRLTNSRSGIYGFFSKSGKNHPLVSRWRLLHSFVACFSATQKKLIVSNPFTLPGQTLTLTLTRTNYVSNTM